MNIMDIQIAGNRPGESGRDIDEEDILRDIDEENILRELKRDDPLLAVSRNKRNPNGFMFTIEDEDEVLHVRLTVEKTKFLLRHIIDAL